MNIARDCSHHNYAVAAIKLDTPAHVYLFGQFDSLIRCRQFGDFVGDHDGVSTRRVEGDLDEIRASGRDPGEEGK